MSARTWNTGDPEPDDRCHVVDNEGYTWRFDSDDPDNEIGLRHCGSWMRQQAVHMPGGGVSFRMTDWEDLLEEHGPLREATAAEAASLVLTFPADDKPGGAP